MIDPLRLAEEIERQRAQIAIPNDEDGVDAYWLSPRQERLVVAALRLAEASLAWEDAEAQTPDDVLLLGVRLDAFRKARES